MQTLLRDPAAGIMHSLIYFGFLILLAVTTVLGGRPPAPRPSAKFLHGSIYEAFAFVGDLGGAMFLGGVIWAIIRRYVQRPYRIRIKSKPEHAVILGTLFADRPHRLPDRDVPDRRRRAGPTFEKWSFIGYPLSWLVRDFGAPSPARTRCCGSSTSSASWRSSSSCR